MTLDPDQLRRAMRTWTTGVTIVTARARESGEPVGLAWHMDTDNHLYTHSGGDPGVSTIVYISMEKQCGYILFTNGGGGEGLRSFVGFIKMVENLSARLLEAAQ